jgi:hypothetical protein
MCEIAIEHEPAATSEPDNAADETLIPLDDLVEQMAEAMAANPAHHIRDRDKAMAYFRANALTRLMATRGLHHERHRRSGCNAGGDQAERFARG